MHTQPLLGVRAVVFDISGTVMDHGSRAPAAAFIELFASRGVTITTEEARTPMGLHKLDHLRAILSIPSVTARWRDAFGRDPGPDTVDQLYRDFPDIQHQAIRKHLDLLPGVAEVSAALTASGIRIGSTTGFESGMMAEIISAAADQGYRPECLATPDQCGGGRPAPWMMFHVARQLGVFPMRAVVKVGDTAADIAEALNAGAWAVGVIRTGNEIGLSKEQWGELPGERQSGMLATARAKLLRAGAHYVIESVADLLPVITGISQRVERGERP